MVDSSERRGRADDKASAHGLELVELRHVRGADQLLARPRPVRAQENSQKSVEHIKYSPCNVFSLSLYISTHPIMSVYTDF